MTTLLGTLFARRARAALTLFVACVACSPPPGPNTAASIAEPPPDQACPTTARWLARHPGYRDELVPVVADSAIPDSLAPVWLSEPRIAYPDPGLTEQWEGNVRVIGIVDTLGHFVHADLCGLQLRRRASEHSVAQSPLPDWNVVDAFARATRSALPPARLTPLVLAGHLRDFVGRVTIYFHYR